MFVPFPHTGRGAPASAAYGLLGEVIAPRPKPAFAIDAVEIDSGRVAVREATVMQQPFCTLLHFDRQAVRADPRVLVVAPLSGHYAALLRDLVLALLPGHDVYVTDWINARDVPLADGPFGGDDNISYVIAHLRRLGPETHVIALCQAAVPALAAAALLAAAEPQAEPRSLTLIAGNVDPRRNPTRVARLLASRPVSWFERTVLAEVPESYAGAGRRVYPGFVQLAGLMLYLGRHVGGRLELFDKLAHDDGVDAALHPFYELYTAVMDLPAEFFLDTVRSVFQEFALPEGRMTWRGQPVKPAALRRAALMTVEGERDDIAAPGQTFAAHDLCPGIPDARRCHHLQPGAGHFSTFHGRAWRSDIMPRIANFIRAS
jgi:poly(3-hydroxybutyrate) depolymerase